MDYWCCLMGICCAFDSPEQFDRLVAMRLAIGVSRDAAEAVVKDDLKHAKSFLAAMKKG